MTRTLDTFEAALLDELRTVVLERSEIPHRRRRRFILGGGAVAASVVGAILIVPGIGPEPAFAVTVDGSGAVHVTVDRLEDADGLEQALEAHGIAADITYLSQDTVCADGRYTHAPPQPRGTEMSFSLGTDGYVVDLAPGSIRDGETIVISAARITDQDPSTSGGITGSVGIATGAVAPCDPVPAPPAP